MPNQHLPHSLVAHSDLTPAERGYFDTLNADELPAAVRHGLCVLLEGILAQRVPGFHLRYTGGDDQPARHGYALCAALLHEDNGFSADEVDERGKLLVEGEISKGRKWLGGPVLPDDGKAHKPYEAALTALPPLTNLLAFYFRLRQKQLAHQFAAAHDQLVRRLQLERL